MLEMIFRVRCDEQTCRGWLSLPENYVPGTDLLPGMLVVQDTAERAALYEDDHRAKMSAVANGWRPVDPDMVLWLCPKDIERARAHQGSQTPTSQKIGCACGHRIHLRADCSVTWCQCTGVNGK